MNNELLGRWARAFLVALAVFTFFSIYVYLRRGMYSLGIANKAFGSTAAVVAGVTLLMGPLSRKFLRLGQYIPLRRPLGILAFVTGLTHVIISLFFIPTRFTVAWYLREWPATITGLTAIVIWLYLATISRNDAIKQLGGSKWVMLQQRGGHIAFIAVFLHLIFLKGASWTLWFASPEYPPESLFVFLIMAGIIGYRIYLKLKHHVRPLE